MSFIQSYTAVHLAGKEEEDEEEEEDDDEKE